VCMEGEYRATHTVREEQKDPVPTWFELTGSFGQNLRRAKCGRGSSRP
jgi:hypothetical protein